MSLTALVAAALLVAAPTPEGPIVVDELPISRGHLRHWADIAQRVGLADRQDAREQSAGLLISFRWMRNEARERGIVLAPGEVRASFVEQRDETFPTRRAFRRYLRDSGQSRDDIKLRVEMDLLSNRVRETVIEGAATEDEQIARLDAFVAEFRRKWRERTACIEPWVVPDCGLAPARG